MDIYTQRKVVFHLVVIMLLCKLTSCASVQKKPLDSANPIRLTTKQKKLDDRAEVTLGCGGRFQTIAIDKISRMTIDIDITNCLMSKGFFGDEKSNEQLASLLRLLGDDAERFLHAQTDSMLNEKYRGSTVFEALLWKANSGINSRRMLSQAFRMIKEIDGYPMLNFRDFLEDKYGIPKEKEVLIRKDSKGKTVIMETDEERAERYKQLLSIVTQNYNAGKVVLKEYGTYYHIFRDDIEH